MIAGMCSPPLSGSLYATNASTARGKIPLQRLRLYVRSRRGREPRPRRGRIGLLCYGRSTNRPVEIVRSDVVAEGTLRDLCGLQSGPEGL